MTESNEAQKLEGLIFLRSPGLEKYRDDEDRPLREGMSAEECRQGVPMEMLECPFPGSRHKHEKKMNASALRQVIKHWDETIYGLSFLRNLLLSDKPAMQMTLLDFWVVARAGATLPTYLIFRNTDAWTVPAFIASILKACIGLFSASQHMMLKSMSTGEYSYNSRPDADSILAFAEQKALLVGRTEVCAGPANLIKECIKAIIEPRAATSSIPNVISDTGQFRRYVNQEQILYMVNFAFPIISYYPVSNLLREVCRHEGDEMKTGVPASLGQSMKKAEKNYPAICRDAGDKSEEMVKIYSDNIYGLFAEIDPRNQVTAYLKKASDPVGPEQQLIKDALYQSSDHWRIEAKGALYPAHLAMLVEGLASYLVIEKTRLKLHDTLLSEINAALGRGAPPRQLDQSDITAAFGITIRDVLCEFFGIQIKNTGDETIIQAGSESFVVRDVIRAFFEEAR